MRLIFRVSSIAGPCSGLSRPRSRVRASFSRVHLAQKLAPERTASGRLSFPPDDDEEFRGGRGKRVNRHPRYAFTYFLRHPTILHNILCQMVALDKFECPIRTGTIRVVTS